MYCIIPHSLDYDVLESSLPEGTEAVWNSSTTYKKNDVVRLGPTLYTSLIDGNSGNNPPSTTSGTAAKWRKSGVTNRGAMFDDRIATQSIAPEKTPLVVSFPWTLATGFALFNISGAAQAHLVISDADGQELLRKDYNLMTGVDNWYDYFAYRFSFLRDLCDFGMSGFLSGTATVTLEGSQPAVGHLVVGDIEEPGATLYGVTAELVNYSVIETNDFGVTDIVERASAKRYECELYLPPARADAVFDLLDKLRARPCVWIGDNRPSARGGHACLTAFGLYRSALLDFQGPNYNCYKIEIMGMI